MLTPQMKVAMLRAMWQAFLQFGGLFLATYTASDDLKVALLAGGSAAFIAMGYRGVAEGSFDSARDAGNQVVPADVGAAPPPYDSEHIAEGAFNPFDINDPSLGINNVNKK